MEFGYDVPFSTETDSRFQCPICLFVLRDAVQTSCGHRFCKGCISRVNKNKNAVLTCPVDKTYSRVDQMFPDVATQREILSLLVVCTNREEGCTWRGELRHLDTHLTTCEMESITCTNGCELITRRADLKDHMEQCPCRKVNCPHCQAQVIHNKLEHHLEECPKLPIKCNLCGEEEVLREQLEEHVNPETGKCPKVVISCPHKVVGCQFQAERYLVDEHLQRAEALQEHMKHASQLIQEHDQVIKDLQRKLAELAEKSEKMFPLLVQTDRLHSQISNELRERNVTGKLHWKVKVGGQARHRCTSYTSPPFYTGCPGYKVQLTLDMEGPREGNHRYTAFSLSLLPGDYDNDVIFPFNATCFVTLYDQVNTSSQPRQNQTHQLVIREVPRNHSRAGTYVDRLYKRDIPKYIKRQELVGSGSRYVRHNSLHFEVTVIHSFYPLPEDAQAPSPCFSSLMAHGSFIVHSPQRSAPTPPDGSAAGPGSPLLRVATLAIGN